MADWLTTLLPAMAGLAGVGLGVWLTQRGAEKLSKQTLDGQRTLANDAAMREWRRQQVVPYLEAANQRAGLWLKMILDTSFYESIPEERRDEMEASGRLKHADLERQFLDPHYRALFQTVSGIPDDAFRGALRAFIGAEVELGNEFTADDIQKWYPTIAGALAALNEAAERYVFSPPPLDKS